MVAVVTTLVCLLLLVDLGHGAGVGTGGITVWTELTLPEQKFEGEIWLARLSPQTDADRNALGIGWTLDSSGWFPTWKLRLSSDVGLIERGSQVLSSVGPAWGHTYESVLSYDETTGHLSVRVKDLTTHAVLVNQTLRLVPSSEHLVVSTTASPLWSASAVRVEETYIPVGVQWDVYGEAATSTGSSPLVLHGNEQLEVRYNVPEGPFTGAFHYALETPDGRRTKLKELEEAGDGGFVVAPSELPVGTFWTVLEYVEGDRVLLAERREVSRGRVTIALRDLALDEDSGAFHGLFTLTTDVSLGEANLDIEAELTPITWDSDAREYLEGTPRYLSVAQVRSEWETGYHEVSASGNVPTSDEPALWRIRLYPRLHLPIHIDADPVESYLPFGFDGYRLGAMSFNIRIPSYKDGVNAWEHRRQAVLDVIAEYSPALIGFQEPWLEQLDFLDRHLTEYERISIKPDRRSGVHNAIYYKTAELERLEWGSFWLSDRPEVAQSATWGNDEARAVIWARFRVRETGQELYFMDTHYHHIDPNEYIAVRSSKLIAERIPGIVGDTPAVLVGDFNNTPPSRAHDILVHDEGAPFRDAWEEATVKRGPMGTFHGWSGEAGRRRIDWVLVRGNIQVDVVEHVSVTPGGVYPTDHWPVYISAYLPIGDGDAGER